MGRDAAPGMLNEMGSRVGKNFFKDTKQSYQGYEVFLKADKMKCIDIIDIGGHTSVGRDAARVLRIDKM